MGSMARMSRNARFIKGAWPLVKKRLNTYQLQEGDLFELVGMGLGSDESDEVVKLYLTLKNQRTGDEFPLSENDVYFDPEEGDVDSIERLGYLLRNDGLKTDIGTAVLRNQKEAYKILAKADLIERTPGAKSKKT